MSGKTALFAAVMLTTLGWAAVAAPPRVARASMAREKAAAPKRGVLGTAADAGQFRTLISLIVAADLFDALREDGPFTVFAPTDEAFEALPKGQLADLLKPENRDKLKKLLLLHVAPGKLSAERLAEHGSPKTLAGPKLVVASNKRGLAVNEATVVKADVACRNGLIHVIDRVLTPADAKTDLLGLAASKPDLKTLVEAVKAAGLVDALGGDGPFTILAPTNEAFGKLPADTLKSLLQPGNRAKLAEVLKYHVIPGRLTAREAVAAGKAKTLQGETVRAGIEDGRLVFNGAAAIATDLPADNGIVHLIDAVLIPE